MERAGANEGTESGERGSLVDGIPVEGSTRAGRRTVSRSGPVSVSVRDTAISVQATRAALIAEEMGRVRVTSRVLGVVVGVGTLLIPFLDGDERARQTMIFGLVVSVIALVHLHRQGTSIERYHVDKVGALGLVPALTLGTAVNFYGVFSPLPMIGSLGLYIACLCSTTRWALAFFAVIAGGHALLSGSILLGLREDPGLITADTLPLVTRAVVSACVVCVYTLTFWAGRSGRATLSMAFETLVAAVQDMSERDAQANEARRELERAAWVGGEGRFTQQRVGSFRLGNIIGRGGMGEVYEAEHVTTGEEAAVKLLSRSSFADPHVVARFAREASAAAALVSPHAVRVLEVPDDSAPVPYLAMERLRGEDLGSLLRREKRLSRGGTLRMVQQVGQALDAARDARVVHRDLKPQNIFLARNDAAPPVWKVLDFGVSKVLGQHSLTRDQLVGTPEYMAPEQARGDAVDHRADLYSLSAVTYRCLTGRAPFSGKDLATIVYRVVHGRPVAPSELAKVGPAVDAVLAIGLARDPAARFSSGAEFARALEDAVAGHLTPELAARASALLERDPWHHVVLEHRSG